MCILTSHCFVEEKACLLFTEAEIIPHHFKCALNCPAAQCTNEFKQSVFFIVGLNNWSWCIIKSAILKIKTKNPCYMAYWCDQECVEAAHQSNTLWNPIQHAFLLRRRLSVPVYPRCSVGFSRSVSKKSRYSICAGLNFWLSISEAEEFEHI